MDSAVVLKKLCLPLLPLSLVPIVPAVGAQVGPVVETVVVRGEIRLHEVRAAQRNHQDG